MAKIRVIKEGFARRLLVLHTRQFTRWHVGVAGAIASVAMTALMFVGAPPVAAQSVKPASDMSNLSLRPAACGVYIVQPGDWLSKIGTRVGLNWQYLAQINHITNPNLIFPGEHIGLCPAAVPAPPVHVAPAVAQHPVVTHPVTAPSHPAAQPATRSTGAISAANMAGEPCHSSVYVTGPVSSWAVPPGCYAGIYAINPANYVSRPAFGQCAWWPEVLHPNDPNILLGRRSSVPAPGAVMVFAPGVQGASSSGHYAEVVAVLGNGWLLISEMNMYWRGGGWGRVSYRYVYLSAGVSFIYS
jgi:LysM repeat protein